MNREEYLRKVNEILDKILALKIELKKTREEYTNSNCPVKVGDNVSLYGVRGQIVSIAIGGNEKFSGRWRKYKKDGTLGLNVFTIYEFEFKYLVKEE